MRIQSSLALMSLVVLSLPSCGGDESTGPVETHPTVSSVTPSVVGGTVGLLQDFTFTFSDAMNPATLNSSTVTVTPSVAGLHLSYDADTRKLWVAPDSLFPPDATVTLSVSSGATDMAGNTLEPFSVNFNTGPWNCANLEDRFEPNEFPQAAIEVEADTPIVGLSTCGEDVDFFEITVSEPVKLTAKTPVTFADSVSWGIYWTRENEDAYATLGTRADPSRNPEYSFSFLPGTYWLKTFGHDDEELVLYDLIIETSAPCQDDRFEDNDFQDQASPLEPGTTSDLIGCDVDPDWYSVPILAGQTITVTFDLGPDFNGIRRLQVTEPGGQTERETGVGGTLTATVVATVDGSALIHTRLWEDDIPYELVVEITGP